MKDQDRCGMVPVRTKGGARALAAFLVAGMALALGGCAQSMSEFAQAAAPGSSQTGPLMLDPQATSTTTIGSGVARPAVLVEETTVPVQRQGQAAASAPPLPVPTETSASATPDGYPNINQVPQQPKGKLLTPEEKAKVIAELEALAKAQNAGAAKSQKSTKCATETVKPADRLKGETAGGEC
jgi:hypothetical protein